MEVGARIFWAEGLKESTILFHIAILLMIIIYGGPIYASVAQICKPSSWGMPFTKQCAQYAGGGHRVLLAKCQLDQGCWRLDL